MKALINAIVLLLVITSTQFTIAQTTYKITLLRAAPGSLLALIENLRERTADYANQGGEKPYVVRHSQGDQWDLMIYEHIGNLGEYFKQENPVSNLFTPPFADDFYNLVSFHESIFADGPAYSELSSLFERNGYFHVEMFVALPGKQADLLKQRQMENIYLHEIGRGANLIFTSVLGGQWDCFTLGGYRDIKHYAESADIAQEVENNAAVKAGFKGVADISPYLRSLIAFHHDTLGGKLE